MCSRVRKINVGDDAASPENEGMNILRHRDNTSTLRLALASETPRYLVHDMSCYALVVCGTCSHSKK